MDYQKLAYTVGVTGDNTVGTLSALTSGDTLVGLDEWPSLCPVDAKPSEKRLRAASARRKRLDGLVAEARAEERAAILEAIDDGMRQVKVVSITGFTREYIRRIRNPQAGQVKRATGD